MKTTATILGLIPFLVACQPLSTANIPEQENAIQVEGQAAMRSEDGTVGDVATAEDGAEHPEGIDFADPDPFIDYDTVGEEKGIESDEND